MATEKGRIGTHGESVARKYLKRGGLRFVAANWSCKAGEVDLIMRDRSTLVFVEVRLRSPTTFGEGFETVARDKQRKLIRTALYYQQKMNYWGDIRFDVVSIVAREDGEFEIDHIEHAFDSDV